jgi:hypoxanthine phosphoribosyltransferase
MAELKVLISREEIAKRIVELGAEITRDFAGQPVILVGVLKGSAIFLADLARQIKLDATFDFIGVSSYGNRPSPTQELKSGWDSTGEVKLTKDVDQSMKDKNVIVVEDILDTGLTLTEDSGPPRQTIAAKASVARRLCRLHHSRRIRCRLRTRLCRTLPQSGGYLHRAAGVKLLVPRTEYRIPGAERPNAPRLQAL